MTQSSRSHAEYPGAHHHSGHRDDVPNAGASTPSQYDASASESYHQQQRRYPEVPRADGNLGHLGPTPGNLDVVLPPLEPQPWVKDIWSWFATNTVGIARIDLRRPTPPLPEQYQGNNLFFASYKQTTTTTTTNRSPRGWGGRKNTQVPVPPPPSAAPPIIGNQGGRVGFGKGQPSAPTYHPQYQQADMYGNTVHTTEVLPAVARSGPPTGARVKLTRNFLVWSDEEKKGKPAFDFGVGLNVDMDRQRVEPVFRLKLANLLSIKAFPTPVLKLSKLVPLANTGMGLKVHYEVPLEQAHHFYRPPARLMVRLDPLPGSGVRLTPAGIEADHTTLALGKNLQVRAGAGLQFPRTLPVDPEQDDFGLKVHRLSLKMLW